MIAANRAEDRARDERGKNRVWRDHAVGKKRARGTKINQSGGEPAPIIHEALADQKC